MYKKKTCAVSGCKKEVDLFNPATGAKTRRKSGANDLCNKHYIDMYLLGEQNKNKTSFCSLQGCFEKRVSNGFCGRHHSFYVQGTLLSIDKKSRRRKIREQIFEGQNNKCVGCNTAFWSHHLLFVDHIVPKSKGGTNKIKNIQLLCGKCNMLKGSRVISIEDLQKENKILGRFFEPRTCSRDIPDEHNTNTVVF